MTFPSDPTIGQRYTAANGQQYEYSVKQVWKSVVGEKATNQIVYTTSPTPPNNPSLGDQWYDTVAQRLKTWTTNGNGFFWRVVAAETVFEGATASPLVAERVLPLMWNYGEQNFSFEAWQDDTQYSWRDYDSAAIVKTTAGDDTIELDNTVGLVLGGRYAVLRVADDTVVATVDVEAVLTTRIFRTRVDFGFDFGPDTVRLVRTSFDISEGFATVKSGDVLFTRPLVSLKNDLKSLLRIRRSAEGPGTFTVQQRRVGTTTWLTTRLLDTVSPEPGYRDEIYSVDPGGPVEFDIRYRDGTGRGDRIEHFALYPTPQAVDNRRVDTPFNLSPADQEINVVPNATVLRGSAFRSLYGLQQNGAEFQIARDEAFVNLALNTSTDTLASWNAAASLGVLNDVAFQDALNLVGVGPSGRIVRSADGGKTSTAAVYPSSSITLQGVDVTGQLVLAVGGGGTIARSLDGGASFATVTAAGGYTGIFYGVAVAGKYALICGANGEIQRTVNNAGIIYAKAPVDNGYTGTFYEVALLANGRGIAVGSGGEIQTTNDWGATWRKRTQAGNYAGTWAGVTLDTNGRAVAVGSNGEIQSSDDFGATWTRRIADNSYVGGFAHVKLYGAQAIAVGTGGEIQTSSNYGVTWTKRATPGANTADLSSVAFTALGDLALIVGNAVAYRPLKLEGAVTTYAVPSGMLAVSSVYYWRVRYQDSAGFWSEYSKPTIFATKSTLNAVMAPINLSPAREATNISVVPTFQASPFVVVGDNDTHNGSQWQISKGAVFGAPVYDSGVVTGDSTAFGLPSASRLDDRSVYSWRVRYRGAVNGWGEWSVPTSFECTAKSTTPRITKVEENSARAVLLTVTPFASVMPGDSHSVTYYDIATSPTFGAASLIRSGTVVYNNTPNLVLPQSVDLTGTARSLAPDTQYYFRVAHKGVTSERSDWSPVVGYRTSRLPAIGEAVFTVPGVYDFVVPEDVTSLCAVVVGGGGGSAVSVRPANDIIEGSGGGGGGLTWKNNIPVTPGQRIQVVVGAGGLPGGEPPYGAPVAVKEAQWARTRGGTSSFGSVISATGGRCWNSINEPNWNIGTEGLGGVALGGDGGGNGGRNATWPANVVYRHSFSAGGGAGGYAGNGGNAGGSPQGQATLATDGQGGGGGGGSRGIEGLTDSNGGGGVGLYGQGENGKRGDAIGNGTGKGGSGGTDGQRNSGGGVARGGYSGHGGLYGGGVGHATDNKAILVKNGRTVYPIQPGPGANGAVRLMWGPGRSFPLNAK